MLRSIMTWLGLLKSKSLEDELQTISKRKEVPTKEEFTIKLTQSSGGFYSWEALDSTGKSLKKSNTSFETKFFARLDAKDFLRGYCSGKRTEKGEHIYKVRL